MCSDQSVPAHRQPGDNSRPGSVHSVRIRLSLIHSISFHDRAPTTPTNPHPSGIIAMPQATLCSRTFSTGEKGNLRCGARSLKMPKPIRLAGMDMIETHPVCKPKYMLEKQMMVPTARPARTPRAVKLRPGTTRVVILT